MITAAIFPAGPMTDETVDEVVAAAVRAGLVACNKMQGPFRIAFFHPNRIPKGWAKFGFIDKNASEVSPCVA